MEVSVELQENFSYIIWPAIVIAVLCAAIIIFMILKQRPKKEKPVEQEVIVEPKRTGKLQIKADYIEKLDELLAKLNAGEIDTRECYQRLSEYIREFAFKMTGVDVTKYTLFDLGSINMPNLRTLIQEYYSPEFEYESKGDAVGAIERTRRVIEGWN